MKPILLLLLCSILTIYKPCFSQNITTNNILLKATIKAKTTNQPLPYASIGVLNKPIGTIADSTGNFNLTIPNENLNDTLQISMVGYWPVKLLVKDFIKTNNIVYLTEKVTQLKEVTVSSQYSHTEIVGRQSGGSLIQASLIPKGDGPPAVGAESGLKLQAPHYPALLDNANVYFSANNFKLIKFRLNFYSLKNNLPDTLLFNKEILVSLNNYKTGWTRIDLTTYDLVINSDCAVTLQWVDYNKDMTQSPQLLIPAGVSFSHINYFRTASQDKWRTAKGNMSFYVALRD